MNPKPRPRCPICRKEVGLLPENRSFPFCSPRCRQVDLGKWLGEEYRVASEVSDARQDEHPEPPFHDDEPPQVH